MDKNKWLAFTNKVLLINNWIFKLFISKLLICCIFLMQSSKKGVIKISIFATPENVNGRVGIGTCGVSGREMTKFSNGEKWRRGAWMLL